MKKWFEAELADRAARSVFSLARMPSAFDRSCPFSYSLHDEIQHYSASNMYQARKRKGYAGNNSAS